MKPWKHLGLKWCVAIVSLAIARGATAHCAATQSGSLATGATIQIKAEDPMVLLDETVPVSKTSKKYSAQIVRLDDNTAVQVIVVVRPAGNKSVHVTLSQPINYLKPGEYEVRIFPTQQKVYGPSRHVWEPEPSHRNDPIYSESKVFGFSTASAEVLETKAIGKIHITLQAPCPPPTYERNRSLAGHFDGNRLDRLAAIAGKVPYTPGEGLRPVAAKLYQAVDASLLPLSEMDRYWLASAWICKHMSYRHTRLAPEEMLYNRQHFLSLPQLEGFCSTYCDIGYMLFREFGVQSAEIDSDIKANHGWLRVKIENVELECDLTWDANPDLSSGWRPKWVGEVGSDAEHKAFARDFHHIPKDDWKRW